MTPKHIFIINPAAGRCDSTNAVAAAVHALSQTREMDYEILTTLRPRHAAQLVRQKAEEYPDRPLRFYACGGDGTLNEVSWKLRTFSIGMSRNRECVPQYRMAICSPTGIGEY